MLKTKSKTKQAKCSYCRKNLRETLLVDDMPYHNKCFERKVGGKKKAEEIFRNWFRK